MGTTGPMPQMPTFNVKPWLALAATALGALVVWVMAGALLMLSFGFDEYVANAWGRRLTALTLLALYPFIHHRLGALAPTFRSVPRGLAMTLIGIAVAFTAYELWVWTYVYSNWSIEPVPGKLTSPTEALHFMLLGGGIGTKLRVLASMTLSAVLEEVFFRGVLLGALLTVLRPWQAVLVSVAFFVAFHLSTNPWYIASLMLMGLAFAWMAIRFGLTAATLLHMAVNLPAFLLFNIDGSESSLALLPMSPLSETGRMLLRVNLSVSIVVAVLPLWWVSHWLRRVSATEGGPQVTESGGR